MGSKNSTRFGISKCQALKKSTANWIHLEIILMLWRIFSFWCDNDVSPFLQEFGSCRCIPPIFLCNNSYVYQACFLSFSQEWIIDYLSLHHILYQNLLHLTSCLIVTIPFMLHQASPQFALQAPCVFLTLASLIPLLCMLYFLSLTNLQLVQ